MSQLPLPDVAPKYPQDLLAAFGTDLTTGTSKSVAVACLGSARIRAHIKTATVGGTLSLHFARHVGTDATVVGASGGIDVTKLTQYGAGNPSDVTVTAGSEAVIDSDCHGEAYAVITLTYTAGAGGAVSLLDVCQV